MNKPVPASPAQTACPDCKSTEKKITNDGWRCLNMWHYASASPAQISEGPKLPTIAELLHTLEPVEAPTLREKIDANLKSGLDWRGRTTEEVSSHHAETDLQREPVEAVSTTPSEKHEFIACERKECSDGGVHCEYCGAPRNHSSHFGSKVSTPLPQQEHGCIGKVNPEMIATGRLPNYYECTQDEARQGEEYARVIMAGGYSGDARDAIATLFACHLAYRRLAEPSALPQQEEPATGQSAYELLQESLQQMEPCVLGCGCLSDRIQGWLDAPPELEKRVHDAIEFVKENLYANTTPRYRQELDEELIDLLSGRANSSPPEPTPLLGQELPPLEQLRAKAKNVSPNYGSFLSSTEADDEFQEAATPEVVINLIDSLTQALTSLAAATETQYESDEYAEALIRRAELAEASLAAAQKERNELRIDLYEVRNVVTADNFAEMQQRAEQAEASLAEAQTRIEALEKELGR
jgi:hypothetical protein